jgi:hypothetical protein
MRPNAFVVRIAGLAVLVAVVPGCAPQSPDHSSWVDQARLALEDASSQVATVTLLLRLEQDGKVLGKYQQVVAQDSETAVGATLQRFGGEQPPPGDDTTYTEVTSALSDASDLLSRARIAIVRRESSDYPALLRQLRSLQRELNWTTEDLG